MSTGRSLLVPLSTVFMLIALAVAGVGLLGLFQTANAQLSSTIDCDEFLDRDEAQRFFEVKGGPAQDPYRLDGDRDGIACEPGPVPTPVSAQDAENCEDFLDYLGDSNANQATVDRYQRECADWREQTGRIKHCPSYQGLNFLYFARLSSGQLDDLNDMQKSEYENLMNYAEGECVPVDVARTSAWECRSLPSYLAEYPETMGVAIHPYYEDQLTKRYQVVCLGAKVDNGKKFSMQYLIGAAVVGAGAVWLIGRYRKNSAAAEQE